MTSKRAALVVALGLVTWSTCLAADAPELALSTFPSKIEVPAEKDAEAVAMVVVESSSSTELKNLQLDSFTDAGVSVAVEAPDAAALPPGGALAWKLRLTRAPEGPSRGSLNLLLRYTRQPPGSRRATSRLVGTTLEVSVREPETVDKLSDVLGVELKTALTSLVELRPGALYVVATNLSNRPVTVTAVEPRDSASLQIEAGTSQPPPRNAPVECKTPVVLDPRASCLFPFVVKARDAVEPGKQLIVVAVAAAWEQQRRQVTARQVLSHEVDVGVFGETALLTALGIPSFLVLPGFLMVVTFGLLWRLVSPGTKFPLEPKDPEFWLAAIGLSILAALTYPVVTGWVWQRRSYLGAYGLTDVVAVWIGSTVLAAVAFAIQDWVRKSWRASRMLSASDRPIDLLRKLQRRRAKVLQPRVEVKLGPADGAQTENVFLIETLEKEQQAWVCSKIVIEWSDTKPKGSPPASTDTPREKRTAAAIRQDIADLLGKEESLVGQLVPLLDEGSREGLKLRWEKVGGLRRVTLTTIQTATPELHPLVEEAAL